MFLKLIKTSKSTSEPVLSSKITLIFISYKLILLAKLGDKTTIYHGKLILTTLFKLRGEVLIRSMFTHKLNHQKGWFLSLLVSGHSSRTDSEPVLLTTHQWSHFSSTRRLRKVSGLTSTLSPILSSLSPFLTEPASERLEMDSLAVFVRLLIGGVAEGSFAVGCDDFWGICEGVAGEEAVMLAAEVDRGEVVLEAWVVCGPLASSSACTFLVSLEGRVNMPFKGSHWKYRTPATEPSFLPMGSSRTIPAHWPGANWVSPRNCINPGLFPFTQTRSPTRKSSTNSSCVSEEGAPDAFSLDVAFSAGAATENTRKGQKRFRVTFKQT